MGVDVSPQVLRSAQVVRIDFGKNVLVKIAPCVILQYLNKADISRRLDCTKVSYRNEGHSLHFLARHRMSLSTTNSGIFKKPGIVKVGLSVPKISRRLIWQP